MLLGWMDLTFPCFLIWPERTEAGSFWLLDCTSAGFYDLRATRTLGLSISSLPLAFGLNGSRNVRRAAARSFDMKEGFISEDCTVVMDAVHNLRPLSHGTPAEQRAKKKAKIALLRHKI